MKKIFASIVVLLLNHSIIAQNVGVGTTNPVARFHVADSSVLFAAPGEATIFPGNPPISGAGRRMMWYPDKGAFRAGYVDGAQWDMNNIGYYSFASGSHNMANGGFSTAMGGGTIASGAYSMTNGYSTLASGFGSTALGFRTTAKAYGSISLGALNDDTDTPDGFNAVPLDRIFQVGNGDINTLVRSNALTVLRNGNTGIGTLLPETVLHVRGSNSNPVIFDGGNDMWVTFAENGVNKGYIGSYYGDPDDVDFGVYYGSTGSLHLTTNNSTPRLTVINNGNVGVGTTTPSSLLHIRQGSAGGNLPYGPLSVESNANTFIGLLSPDAAESGIIFGRNGDNVSGGIIYNNSGNQNGLQFRTNGNANRMVITNTGNVGIGTTTPGFPLNFANTLGDKISLWGNSGNHYGFGINNALLQVHTDGSGSDIAFGYGSNASFTEKFRMKGNGALVINGNAGSTGQVLQSNGNNASPSWSNPSSALYNGMTEYSQSSDQVMAPQTSYALPGISNVSLVITSVSKVIFSASVEVERGGCGGCGSSEESVFIQMTPPLTNVAIGTLFLFPGEKSTVTVGMKFMTLNPGTYTVNTYLINGVNSNSTARSGRLNIIVVPQ